MAAAGREASARAVGQAIAGELDRGYFTAAWTDYADLPTFAAGPALPCLLEPSPKSICDYHRCTGIRGFKANTFARWKQQKDGKEEYGSHL
jgi:hypothetical protein